jgi:GNAT superfamily N-acetyltransferase
MRPSETAALDDHQASRHPNVDTDARLAPAKAVVWLPSAEALGPRPIQERCCSRLSRPLLPQSDSQWSRGFGFSPQRNWPRRSVRLHDRRLVPLSWVASTLSTSAERGRPAPMDDDYTEKVHRGEVFVADDDGVVGLLVLIATPARLLIENVAVDPVCQGAGIGRALLSHAKTYAKTTRRFRAVAQHQRADDGEPRPISRLGYREEHRRTENGFQRVFFSKPLGFDLELLKQHLSPWAAAASSSLTPNDLSNTPRGDVAADPPSDRATSEHAGAVAYEPMTV